MGINEENEQESLLDANSGHREASYNSVTNVSNIEFYIYIFYVVITRAH
jgi:hypothetical protein